MLAKARGLIDGMDDDGANGELLRGERQPSQRVLQEGRVAPLTLPGVAVKPAVQRLVPGLELRASWREGS
jgi:hypothetical protein